ncbi:hypothetical protein AB5I41_01520 [Sphingomonas sp. MMS24-JH45]
MGSSQSTSTPTPTPTPLSIAGAPGGASVGTPYTFTPTVTGGSGTKTYSYSGPMLSAAGLSFSTTTGTISGTPTTGSTLSGHRDHRDRWHELGNGVGAVHRYLGDDHPWQPHLVWRSSAGRIQRHDRR